MNIPSCGAAVAATGQGRSGAGCHSCFARPACLPGDRLDTDCQALDRLVERRHVLLRGEHLYHAGEPVRQRLFAIQHGHFKVYQLAADGRQRVTGFPAAGDLLGIECIGASHHRNSVAALTDAMLCEFSHARLADAAARDEALALRLNRLLLAQVGREHATGTLLSCNSADQRLAAFLRLLSTQRFNRFANGDQLELVMTRADMGDYLGLAAETVSRTLKRFQMLGYLAVGARKVTLLDAASLRLLARGASAGSANNHTGPAPTNCGAGPVADRKERP